jgi:hypothetical protein
MGITFILRLLSMNNDPIFFKCCRKTRKTKGFMSIRHIKNALEKPDIITNSYDIQTLIKR